jgi:hypothetical protein
MLSVTLTYFPRFWEACPRAADEFVSSCHPPPPPPPTQRCSNLVGGTTVGRIWSLRPRSALRGRRLQVRREERAPPRAKAAPCPRPRGRSPPGCTWDEQQGGWWKANGSEWQSPNFPKPKDPKPLKARPIGQRLSRRSLRHGVRARRRYASTAPPSTAPSTSTRSMTRCAASVPRRAGVTPGALHITPADEPHTDQHSRVPQVVFFENGSFTRTQIAVRRWRESRKSELTSIYIIVYRYFPRFWEACRRKSFELSPTPRPHHPH